MIASNVSEAIRALLFIAEECPGCLPEEVGQREYESVQLALDVDQSEFYKTLVVGFNIEFGNKLAEYLGTIEMYDSAIKVREAVNRIKAI